MCHEDEFLEALRDKSRPKDDRIRLINQVTSASRDDGGCSALFHIAQDTHEDEAIHQEAGRRLALLFGTKLAEGDLRDFAGPAFIAFDEEVARRLRDSH